MSTGYKPYDFRQPQYFENGTVWIGRYGDRYWAGTDSFWNGGVLVKQENWYHNRRRDTMAEVARWTWFHWGDYIPYAFSSDTIGPQPLFEWSDNDTLDLWSKMATKVRSHDFTMSVFLAEGRQSLDMITDTSNTIYEAMLCVAKKEHRKARRILRIPKDKMGILRKSGQTMGESWLAYSWGWKPLVSDLTNAAKAVFDITNQDHEVHYRVHKKRISSWSAPLMDARIKHAYTRKVLRAVFPAPIPKWKTLGLLNWESAAYETMPYSWLLDYMIPIGDYLDTVGLLAQVNTLGVKYYISTLQNSVCYDYVQSVNSDRRILPCPGAYDKRSEYWRDETIVSDIPFPGFVPLNEMLSWRRAANCLSLVAARKLKIAKYVKRNYGE